MTIRTILRATTAFALLSGLVACGGDGNSPTSASAPTASLAIANGVVQNEEFEVCKDYAAGTGPTVTINYTVDFDANGSNEISSSVQVAGGTCAIVHTYRQLGSNNGTQPQRVTVTEVVPAGYTSTVTKTTLTSAGAQVTGPTAGNSATGDM